MNYTKRLQILADNLTQKLNPESDAKRFEIMEAYVGKQLVLRYKSSGVRPISEGFQGAKDCYLSALESLYIYGYDKQLREAGYLK